MNQPALPIIEKLPLERPREIGTLTAGQRNQRVALPLAAHRIVARVADRVAEVTVEQSFQNPFQEFLEAVYVFPLGGGAAVCGFEMKVGDRTLRGIVKERGQARLDYGDALDKGKHAALLEQERDNVFTVQVGNLPPGEEVSVRIVYSERLSYFEDGTTELRLPLVVAPRYIPGGALDGVPVGGGVQSDTDAVPDASRITPPRLAPGFDPKVALSVEVEIADGAPSDIACSQHAVKLANGRISLSREDEPLNRDFVLRWRLANDRIQPRLLLNRGGYAMLSLVAPRREGFLGTPRDVVFIVDRSGSMSGVKMASAARACSTLIETLGPRDTFAICAFSNSTAWMQWTPGDEAGIGAGGMFLRQLDAAGGTELDHAFEETLTHIRARQQTMGREPVIVLITDGQVGNEAQIFKRLQRDRAGVRVFTVGIDTAVNDAFLQRVSALCAGTSICCAPGEALDQALASVAREIGAPVITDIEVDGADLLAPSPAPDLFAGRVSTAFFVGQDLKSVRVRGKFADGSGFSANVKAEEIDLPAIAHLWARARVTDLEDRFRFGEDVRQEIIDLAVKHRLLTRFTAFVVVDESETVNEKGQRRTVVQPVEMPDRWQMGYSLETQSPADPMIAMCLQDRASMPKPPILASTANFGRPASKPVGSTSRILHKLQRALGGTPKTPLPKADEVAAPGASPLSKSHRAAIKKVMALLLKALQEARGRLDGGVVPDPEPIEQARQALIEALAVAGPGVGSDGLQKFLRSSLVELIAVLGIGSAVSVKPIFDRVQKEFDALDRPNNFWEATV